MDFAHAACKHAGLALHFILAFRWCAEEMAEVGWLAKGRISHRDVAPDSEIDGGVLLVKRIHTNFSSGP